MCISYSKWSKNYVRKGIFLSKIKSSALSYSFFVQFGEFLLWIVEQHDDKKHSVPIGNILIFAIYTTKTWQIIKIKCLSHSTLYPRVDWRKYFFNFECQFFNKYFFRMATATEASEMERKREEKSCYF